MSTFFPAMYACTAIIIMPLKPGGELSDTPRKVNTFPLASVHEIWAPELPSSEYTPTTLESRNSWNGIDFSFSCTFWLLYLPRMLRCRGFAPLSHNGFALLAASTQMRLRLLLLMTVSYKSVKYKQEEVYKISVNVI